MTCFIISTQQYCSMEKAIKLDLINIYIDLIKKHGFITFCNSFVVIHNFNKHLLKI